jgi:Rrf2 family protein
MLSKKTQYAFQALMYLAQKEPNEPVLIAEISKKKKIPLKFLENILLELKNAGILESKKGKGGGYYFKESPKKVKLSAVMRLLDGPIALRKPELLRAMQELRREELWPELRHGFR